MDLVFKSFGINKQLAPISFRILDIRRLIVKEVTLG
jgi:hypothetical protein